MGLIGSSGFGSGLMDGVVTRAKLAFEKVQSAGPAGGYTADETLTGQSLAASTTGTFTVDLGGEVDADGIRVTLDPGSADYYNRDVEVYDVDQGTWVLVEGSDTLTYSPTIEAAFSRRTINQVRVTFKNASSSSWSGSITAEMHVLTMPSHIHII